MTWQPDQNMPRPKDPIAYLAEVLSSRVRAQVLPYLVARSNQAFSLTQIARGLGLSVSSVQHECYKLERLGILHGRPLQGSRRYQLNRSDPPARALIALVRAVFEPQAILGMALVDLTAEGLQAAVLAGSVAPDTTSEPTFLLLVGDLSLDHMERAQERVAMLLDVPADSLEVAFFHPEQWRAHVTGQHDFVTRLQKLSQIPIVGSIGDLAPGPTGAHVSIP